MANLIERIRGIRDNLATAQDEFKIVDDLLDMPYRDVTKPDLLKIAERMRAVATAKDGDWFTHTFTPSTAAELRALADAYEEMAKEPRLWTGGTL